MWKVNTNNISKISRHVKQTSRLTTPKTSFLPEETINSSKFTNLNLISQSFRNFCTSNSKSQTGGSSVSSSSTLKPKQKLACPPIVYVSGEEMTRYAMQLILDKWIHPNVDTSKWEFFDLSCKSRDNTNDQVLKDVIESGKRLGSIFKEPTVTPTSEQQKKLGLKKAWGSPNGAMRRGWNGITISRDTIHIAGMELGYKKPVLFERHAVGGEYGAGWGMVGAGKLKTMYYPKETPEQPVTIDERNLSDNKNAVVTYHNPLDNVADLAHHFFKRCLEQSVTPYVVTKKTVFKWQEEFWLIMKRVFDESYKQKYLAKGLLTNTGGELCHLISDAATMQIIRWTDGGFGMAAHNYDGDMLTDELAQMHRSPGFITSNLIGKISANPSDPNCKDTKIVMEFEASHGTVSDMYNDLLAGKETSLNPLGLVEALIGAMNHAVNLDLKKKHPTLSDEELKALKDKNDIIEFTSRLRRIMHRSMVEGKGTRDISGPNGLTTEQFVDHVARILEKTTPEMKELLKKQESELKRRDVKKMPVREKSVQTQIDVEGMKKFFNDLDSNGDGNIDFEEFCAGMINIGVYPKKFFQDPARRPK